MYRASKIKDNEKQLAARSKWGYVMVKEMLRKVDGRGLTRQSQSTGHGNGLRLSLAKRSSGYRIRTGKK